MERKLSKNQKNGYFKSLETPGKRSNGSETGRKKTRNQSKERERENDDIDLIETPQISTKNSQTKHKTVPDNKNGKTTERHKKDDSVKLTKPRKRSKSGKKKDKENYDDANENEFSVPTGFDSSDLTSEVDSNGGPDPGFLAMLTGRKRRRANERLSLVMPHITLLLALAFIFVYIFFREQQHHLFILLGRFSQECKSYIIHVIHSRCGYVSFSSLFDYLGAFTEQLVSVGFVQRTRRNAICRLDY